MPAFWTLIKREYLDHKGGMFWTPLVISSLMAVVIAVGAVQLITRGDAFNGSAVVEHRQEITPSAQQTDTERTTIKADGTKIIRKVTVAPDGRRQETITVFDSSGKTVSKVTVDATVEAFDDEDFKVNGEKVTGLSDVVTKLNTSPASERINGTRNFGAGLAALGAIGLLIAAIVIPFLLLGSLFDERQDRSILFWKSMPVSDSKTVLSKLVGNAGGGFLLALGFGFLVHILALIAATIIGSYYGFTNVASLWHLPTIASAWFNWFLLIFQYLLWVLPVYAWFMLVSATSPRAPFLFAFLVPGAIAILEAVVFKGSWFAENFLYRLVGIPLANALKKMSVTDNSLGESQVFLSQARELLLKNFAEPSLWIGLVIAAALLYATIEMRKRKAL